MMIDTDTASAERTEAARRLIDQAAADEVVHLATVSGMDLCVLGGPKQSLFSAVITQAWLNLPNRQRKKLVEHATDHMVERGLLVRDSPHTDDSYQLSPKLGLALAARCRPAYIVVSEAEGRPRSLNLFALSDEENPVRGIVAEVPIGMPGDLTMRVPRTAKLTPLGLVYQFALMSRYKAAELLAGWTIRRPPMLAGADENAPYVITMYQHYGEGEPVGFQLRVWGDGTRAHVLPTGDADLPKGEYDVDELRRSLLDLLPKGSR